jgi:quercetin dioxygenase-like cupin family protein
MKRFVFTRRRAAVVMVALVAIGAAGIYVLPSGAQEPPPPIVSEPLTPRSVFPDQVDMKLKLKMDGRATQVVNQRDPSRTVVVRYTVQPGAQFPWHTHAGPVVVNIVSGSLTYLPAETCVGRTYTAGQAFVDAGHGHVHTAFNPGSEPMTFVATFFGAPATGPLLIPAQPAC